jgi:dienelactone hydrolase
MQNIPVRSYLDPYISRGGIMSKILAAILLSFLVVTPMHAVPKLHSEMVPYELDGVAMEGYLVYDQSIEGPRPGVLVVHEWNGIGDYVKGRADQLAELGYVAFTADIYGVKIRPKTMEESSAAATSFYNDRKLLRARANAALDVLRKNPLTDKNKIVAIGYCFGGSTVLELAMSGADIKGIVTFHGGLASPTPGDLANFHGKVLVCHGADDPYNGPDVLTAFIDECRKAKVDYQIDIYGGAVHGFTNPSNGNDPSKGVAYNADADHRSWQAMKEFFGEIFK